MENKYEKLIVDKKNLTEYEKLLNDEYLEKYQIIVYYIKVEELNVKIENEIYQDILDMMLSAQSDNIKVEKVVGKDIYKFCNNIIKEYTNQFSLKNMSFNIIALLAGIVTSVMFISILFNYESSTPFIVEVKIETFVIVLTIMISQIFSKIMSKNIRIFRSRKKNHILINYSSLCLFLLINLGICNIFIDSYTVVECNGIKIGVISFLVLILALFFKESDNKENIQK